MLIYATSVGYNRLLQEFIVMRDWFTEGAAPFQSSIRGKWPGYAWLFTALEADRILRTISKPSGQNQTVAAEKQFCWRD